MSALELISLANQLLFVGLFVVVLWHAVRRGTRAGFDTALLFGSITAVLVGSRVADASGVREAPLVTSLILAALSLPPYAMLRLVDDFRGTPRWTQVAGGIAYLAIAAAAFAFPVVPELVELAIVDHGVGIPDAERDRIFERFYRASNAQGITDTGMGLGLYICRRIVEEHGGRIWVEVTPGGGSTFTVALPLEQPDADTRGETRPHIDDTAEPITEPSWNASAGAEATVDA